MTYMTVARRAAQQESRALRAFATQHRTPRCAPIDRWDEWIRSTHTSATSYRAVAA